MTDEQKMLQRMGAMLVKHIYAGDGNAPNGSDCGLWIHSPDCENIMNCSCGALHIAYTTDRDGDVVVHEVRNNGKLRVRLGERG